MRPSIFWISLDPRVLKPDKGCDMREWIAITDEIGPERVFHVEKRDLFSLPVDILIPGAGPWGSLSEDRITTDSTACRTPS